MTDTPMPPPAIAGASPDNAAGTGTPTLPVTNPTLSPAIEPVIPQAAPAIPAVVPANIPPQVPVPEKAGIPIPPTLETGSAQAATHPVMVTVPADKPKSRSIKTALTLGVLALIIGVSVTAVMLRTNILPQADEPLVLKPDPNVTPIRNYQLKSATKPAPSTPWMEKISSDNPPAPPTTRELDNLFGQLQSAFATRNWTLFQKVASARFIYIYENNAAMVGTLGDGQPVSETGNPRGEELFLKYGPGRLHHPVPLNHALLKAGTPEKSEIRYFPEDETILVDKVSGKEYYIVEKNYAESYALPYTVIEPDKIGISTANSPADRHGMVRFVYENGQWKVFDQEWYVQRIPGGDYGDTKVNAPVTEVTAVSDYVYTPQEVSIGLNQKIRWSGITGVILGTDPDNPWQTPYLTDETFEKVFTVAGTYPYAITRGNTRFEGTVTVR